MEMWSPNHWTARDCLLGSPSDFPDGSVVKNLSAKKKKKKNLSAMQEMQEMQFLSLSEKDSLEEEMATYSSIFAWKIPQTEESSRL